MAERSLRYWALCSNPDYYRIEDAVVEVEFDNWVTKGSEIKSGDRAIIWKTKGRSDTSGIVALAEIVADPSPAPDLHPEYQRYEVPPHHHVPIEEMVTLRYMSAPNLPLWLNGPCHNLLSSLSIVRGGARRSVYHIEPEQWTALMGAAGGWPNSEHSTEVQSISRVLNQQIGKRNGGQGFQRDSGLRRATERRAMTLAWEHYQEAGWTVEDVSATQPYDLRCIRVETEELRVEVKGTTGEGSYVLLTANEVAHARTLHPRVALCVVMNISVSLTADGHPEAWGGELRVIEPWQIEEDHLTPVTYAYRVPLHKRT